ncbi:hypothetical protein JDV02_002836 [Purpureocillium takamizusanense]|uniref:Uncharacterized protein n=1 Tax=Purpureocillium takamizusanense TaxID=2060973 RepID=A0A9Q8V982_9HYPO|nr:uncharacterized protein JDV02_002836 [Purpureocillium takamizusanense]UNI16401.1 hypothetical protein JDV02_002836 [Purpureocillium takamizusanense]
MWPFTSSCLTSSADACTAPAAARHVVTLSTVVSLAPFACCFALVAVLAARHVFPRLGGGHDALRDGEDHVLPAHAPASLRQAHAEHGRKSWARRGAAWAFGATVGLAAALAMLILAEIATAGGASNGSGIGHGRELAKGEAVVLPALLAMLVTVVPWIECRALVTGMGWSFQRTSKGRIPRVAWALQALLFGGWLFAFWSIGRVVPESAVRQPPARSLAGSAIDRMLGRKGGDADDGTAAGFVEILTRACLERVGVVGIALMALLAGFASVSAPWHTFVDTPARRGRPVTEADVSRKQAGLDATSEMLLTKRHRLQQLERRALETAAAAGATSSSGGLVGKFMGGISIMRGAVSTEEAEMRQLRLEIAGLEDMEANLASSVEAIRGHRAAAQRASTALGRLTLIPAYVFGIYCVYRVLATCLTTARRMSLAWWSGTPLLSSSASDARDFSLHPTSGGSDGSSFSSSDPVSRFLGLLARHWDPQLDQLAWARAASFALSGFMLAASARSAAQTFHLLARWVPAAAGLRRQARSHLALAAGEVAGAYVVSAGWLLRGQLPREAGGRGLEGMLGGGQSSLRPGFVDGWFEGWFLLGAGATMLGVWVARRGWEMTRLTM